MVGPEDDGPALSAEVWSPGTFEDWSVWRVGPGRGQGEGGGALLGRGPARAAPAAVGGGPGLCWGGVVGEVRLDHRAQSHAYPEPQALAQSSQQSWQLVLS